MPIFGKKKTKQPEQSKQPEAGAKGGPHGDPQSPTSPPDTGASPLAPSPHQYGAQGVGRGRSGENQSTQVKSGGRKPSKEKTKSKTKIKESKEGPAQPHGHDVSTGSHQEPVLPTGTFSTPGTDPATEVHRQFVSSTDEENQTSFVFAVLPAHNQMHSHLFDYTGRFHPGGGLGIEAEQLPSLCPLPGPPVEERVEDEDEEFGTPPNTPDEPRQFPPNATDEEIAASMTDSDKIKRLQTTVDQFHKKYEDTRRQLEEEKQALSARVAQLQQKLEAKEHETKEFGVLENEKEKIQELTEIVKETQQEKAMMQTKSKMKEREIERLRKALMRATEGLAVDPKEADAYIEQLVELTKKVTEHEVTEREQKKKIEDLQKLVDRAHLLEEHLTQAATELSAKEKESKQLHKVLKGQGMEEMEGEIDQLRPFEQQVEELQAQLDEAQQREQTNDDHIRALEERLRAKEEELHRQAVFPHDQPAMTDHSTEVTSLKKQLEEKGKMLYNLEVQLQALGYEKVAHEREQFQRHAKKQSEEVKKLKQELEAAKRDKLQLQKDKLKLEQEKNTAQWKVEACEADLSTVEREIAKSTKELESQLKVRTTSLKLALATEKEDRARLQEDVQKLEDHVRDLELELQLTQTHAQVAQIEAHDSVQHALSEANADRKVLTDRLDRITRERDQANQKCVQLIGIKENLEVQVSQVDGLQSEVTQTRAETMKWREMMTKQQEEINNLLEMTGNKHQEISILQESMEILTKENQELKGELEARKAQAVFWKQDFEAERREREKAAGKRDDEEALTHLVLQKLNGELKQCHADIAEYKAEIKEKSKLGKKLEAYQTELDKHKTEVQRYKTQAEKKGKVKEKYETCQAELQQCRADLEYHKRQLREHQAQGEKYKSLYETEHERNLHLSNETERIRTVSKSSQREKAQSQVELTQVTTTLRQKEGDLFTTQTALSTAREAYQQLQARNQTLQQQITQQQVVLSQRAQGDELAPYIIPAFTMLEGGQFRGSGSYGSVHMVEVSGSPCIAKRLHDILVGRGNEEYVNPEQSLTIQRKFRQECVLLSRLRHPNIVQFIGVHQSRDPSDLTLVMECLHVDLDRCLRTYRNIPLPIKLSILLDVSYGLLYLHSQQPSIIHRDLTAANILLTTDMKAKIADLGVSKILDLHPQQVSLHTRVPGTLAYMPPEALKWNPDYNTKLDDFSLGVVTLYVAIQEFPFVSEEVTYTALKNEEIQIRKRIAWIEMIPEPEQCLRPLIIHCLQDNPERRLTTAEITHQLKQLSEQHPKEFQDVLQMHSQISQLGQQVVSLQQEKEEIESELGQRIAEDVQRIPPQFVYTSTHTAEVSAAHVSPGYSQSSHEDSQ